MHVHLPVHARRPAAWIDCRDPDPIVVAKDVLEDPGFDLVYRHSVYRQAVDQLLFQRGAEAFHPGVIVTMIDATQALLHLILFQEVPKGIAGILTSAVAVQNRPFRLGKPENHGIQSGRAELFAHIIGHPKCQNFSIKAVQNRRDIKLSIHALDLRDVSQGLFKRLLR